MAKVTVIFWCSALIAAADRSQRLETELEQALAVSGAPGMAAAIFDTEAILARTDLGRRRADKAKGIGADDRWHIGSDGKAMTATLIARLVERKELSWETPMAEVFGPAAKKFHPQAQRITVRQLLSHTAGLTPNPSEELRRAAQRAGARRIRKQRLEVVKEALTQAPASEPGTAYLYSNTGYIVAGAVVEKVLGTTWEKAIEKEVFAPLGIASAGFGAPTGASQPRGHRLGPKGGREPVDSGYDGDNPAIYGPAGGIHLALADWVTFLQDQMLGHRGKGKLLRQETYRELHRRVRKRYALGWGVSDDGTVLRHDGSNTYWYATAELRLDAGVGMVAVANDAGPETGKSMRRALADAMAKEE